MCAQPWGVPKRRVFPATVEAAILVLLRVRRRAMIPVVDLLERLTFGVGCRSGCAREVCLLLFGRDNIKIASSLAAILAEEMKWELQCVCMAHSWCKREEGWVGSKARRS